MTGILMAAVHGDFLEVDRFARSGRLVEALERYGGPLLPYSEAPAPDAPVGAGQR